MYKGVDAYVEIEKKQVDMLRHKRKGFWATS